MLFTKKAINAALPRITYLQDHYLYTGQTGLVPKHSSLIKYAVFYDHNGEVASWISGYGDAVPRDIYQGNYTGANAVEVVEEWMKGRQTRAETVDAIQAMILAESETPM